MSNSNQVADPSPPVPTPPAEVTQAQRDGFAYLQGVLQQYGLESLSDWGWEQIINGNSADQIIQSMRQRQEYKDRFSGLAIRQEKGLPAMSEGEYVAYERQAYQLMRDAGLPLGFYDTRSDFAALIGNDISINELNHRVTVAYQRVAQAPPEVRDAFTQFFGPEGDVAFAAYFLDPDKASPLIDKAVTEAEIAGTGMRFGVGVSQQMADRLASYGVDLSKAEQGFGQLADMKPIFDETITESNDLTAANEGVGAVFGTDHNAKEAVAKRLDNRKAQFGGVNSEAFATQQGIVGLGSASNR